MVKTVTTIKNHQGYTISLIKDSKTQNDHYFCSVSKNDLIYTKNAKLYFASKSIDNLKNLKINKYSLYYDNRINSVIYNGGKLLGGGGASSTIKNPNKSPSKNYKLVNNVNLTQIGQNFTLSSETYEYLCDMLGINTTPALYFTKPTLSSFAKINVLNEIMNYLKFSTASTKNNDLLMIFGKRDSGKTTFANFVVGCEFERCGEGQS